MSSKTINSEEARVNLSEILDQVGQGSEVVSARYDKPVGVLIPYAAWLEIKRRRRARHQRRRKAMDNGKDYTMEQVEAMPKTEWSAAMRWEIRLSQPALPHRPLQMLIQ